MSLNPLDQFKIKTIYEINAFGFDISLTNSALFMVMSTGFAILFFMIALSKKKILPNKTQMSAEIIFDMILSGFDDIIGSNARSYFPIIFSLFLFILFANLAGMLPYGFTSTSHIIVTFSLAMLVFLLITLVGIFRHGFKFLKLFLPSGTPLWMAPLMILIELFAYLARPVSLSLRLGANMIAGHVLLKVIASFMVMMPIYFKITPLPVTVILIGFEFFVAILQAYIFTILSCVYLNDAINLH